MHVLILGYGFLGKPLAWQLRQLGANLRVVKRQPCLEATDFPVDLVTLNHQQDISAWSAYTTWVVLLPPSQVADYAETLATLATASAQAGVQHWVLASSISVYGSRARLCHENTPTEPESASAQAMVAAEHAVMQSLLPFVDIVRLGGLYADERHPVHRLLQRQNNTGGQQPVNMIHRDAAVAALLRAIQAPKQRRITNVVEHQHPSKAEFYAQAAQRLGLPAPHFAVDDERTGKSLQAFGIKGLQVHSYENDKTDSKPTV